MRKAIAIAFVLAGFSAQAFGDGCTFTADCPIDGATSKKVRCQWNGKTLSNSCLYEHKSKDGSNHQFWVVGCD